MQRVSNHGAAPSFETRRCAMLLRMRAEKGRQHRELSYAAGVINTTSGKYVR